ncbi:YciI family protein [Sinorhizobium sp. BG8]|uniref:YciI family protein n=1 Tax=Sinorhizobium sp. BG8 TaxID=2613773 RepID=UPI00193EBFF4|nr:YciI family protein [Sinorhizobium sp. BG8]QRM53436.1 hypothetical protein F3Y30_01815 [Sinorhizobium sp. BG8]
MAYFHLKLVPPRPRFPHDANELEKAAFDRHAAYWREKAAARTAIAVGPVFEGEGAWGMAVVEVATFAEAEALAGEDPVIRAGLGFRFDVSPMPSLILRPDLAG